MTASIDTRKRSMTNGSNEPLYRLVQELPPHLESWQLPPDWRWGPEGVVADLRHYQEVIDALGRSLSLVTAPDPEHADWLFAEARHLARLSHPAVPTTYHWWGMQPEAKRGPGYLRRWITGETVGGRLRRLGPSDVPYTLQILRSAGAALVYLHDAGTTHGSIGADTVYTIPSGRLWFLGWQWALDKSLVPKSLQPDTRWMPVPPEWNGEWKPDAHSDQWQLAALCYATMVGELPPSHDVPPVRHVRPDCPLAVASILDRALSEDPAERFMSVGALLRTLDRVASPRTVVFAGTQDREDAALDESPEARLRWALGDEYEVLGPIGSGSFGSVWRVRDLALERVVALKMLHPHIARDETAVARFQREARLAASLGHPAIVPVYDWDARGEVAWYTMELGESGSLADLVARSGPRRLSEVGPQVEQILEGLAAAHAAGIIHRDLKPENILVDRYRFWRIGDFGIANVTGEDATGGATGTPKFSAPEQLLGEPQGPQVDFFGVAAIVVFALTGEPPFHGADAKTVLAQQLGERADLDFAPPPIQDWLRKGLAPDPEKRFTDAEEMIDEWSEAWGEATRRAMGWSWLRRVVRGAS